MSNNHLLNANTNKQMCNTVFISLINPGLSHIAPPNTITSGSKVYWILYIPNAIYLKNLLISFEHINKKDSGLLNKAQQKLNDLIYSPLLDNNNKPIRKVKFYRTNLTGFNIRGGLATKEKIFKFHNPLFNHSFGNCSWYKCSSYKWSITNTR